MITYVYHCKFIVYLCPQWCTGGWLVFATKHLQASTKFGVPSLFQSSVIPHHVAVHDLRNTDSHAVASLCHMRNEHGVSWSHMGHEGPTDEFSAVHQFHPTSRYRLRSIWWSSTLKANWFRSCNRWINGSPLQEQPKVPRPMVAMAPSTQGSGRGWWLAFVAASPPLAR
jgi:hypothetical protein